MNAVVVVESPAKAKTINKYLGPDYTVLASFGHVRDLPAKDGSVRPEQDFAMDWEVEDRAKKRIDDIARALKGADRLYLATDPDREGEAISWHVREILDQRRALEKVDVKRIVFYEITRNAVLDAVEHARDVNRELVDAYLARRALDYLVGFTLSPVLWRKLPGSRSAGRVQSVALRLICEREAEIEAFKPQEFWTIEGLFATAAGQAITARLTHLEGKKLGKFDLPNQAQAHAAVAAAREGRYAVSSVERKQVRRNPQPPFTTSTLQQEASRKLRLAASQTMRLAQRLYEGVDLGGETVGLITYMRTDSVNLAQEAMEACRGLIDRDFGRPYLPDGPRTYRNSARNAQEAHEAIRPTDLFRRPADVARFLQPEELRLYELIWKRAVASQMESARLDQVAVDIAANDNRAVFRATGSVIVFDGFLKLYQEDQDDPAEEEAAEGRRLPNVAQGEALDLRDVKPDQHFTQPPPRYSEASLVKRLEELGIGRPSTYASILQVLQDRDYVRLEARRFVPEDRGRLVTAFLTSYFERYVEYNFTAELEQKLDDVSNGRIDWRQLLREFWQGFIEKVDDIKDLRVGEVLTTLDQELGQHFFPPGENGRDPRLCPACTAGRLGLKLGRHGAFIGCSNYPECRYTRPLAMAGEGDAAGGAGTELEGPRALGSDPATGQGVTLRKGPFGVYVQLGEPEGKEKPKRASLPKGMAPDDVSLEKALALLALPREVGRHPETGQPIMAGLGRFGPYLKHGDVYKSLGPDEDVLTIGANRAVDLLAEARGGRGGAGLIREVGPHPDGGAPITLHRGRFGPYLKHDRVMASLPRSADPETITVEDAVPLLAARAAKAGTGKSGARARGRSAAAKSAAKKPAAAKSKAKRPASKPARPASRAVARE